MNPCSLQLKAILNHWTIGEVSSHICVFGYSAWDPSSVTRDWTWSHTAAKAPWFLITGLSGIPYSYILLLFFTKLSHYTRNNLWDIGNGAQECFTRYLKILLIFSKSQLWIHFHTWFAVCYFHQLILWILIISFSICLTAVSFLVSFFFFFWCTCGAWGNLTS